MVSSWRILDLVLFRNLVGRGADIGLMGVFCRMSLPGMRRLICCLLINLKELDFRTLSLLVWSSIAEVMVDGTMNGDGRVIETSDSNATGTFSIDDAEYTKGTSYLAADGIWQFLQFVPSTI
jgi:hypothetical protein